MTKGEFYNIFAPMVKVIETASQQACVFDMMEDAFRKSVLECPQSRNELAQVYEELKILLWKAV